MQNVLQIAESNSAFHSVSQLLHLYLQVDVNQSSIESSLQLVSRDGRNIGVRFDFNTSTPGRLFYLYPEQPLKTGELCDIIIPDSTIVGNYGGPRKGAIQKTCVLVFQYHNNSKDLWIACFQVPLLAGYG